MYDKLKTSMEARMWELRMKPNGESELCFLEIRAVVGLTDELVAFKNRIPQFHPRYRHGLHSGLVTRRVSLLCGLLRQCESRHVDESHGQVLLETQRVWMMMTGQQNLEYQNAGVRLQRMSCLRKHRTRLLKMRRPQPLPHQRIHLKGVLFVRIANAWVPE